MKINLYSLWTLFAGMSLVAGCQDAPGYEYQPDSKVSDTPKVYLRLSDISIENEFKDAVTLEGTNIIKTESNDFKIPVKITEKVPTDIQVHLGVAADKVDIYNKEHGTDYGLLPEKCVEILHGTLTIPKGTQLAADSAVVRLSAIEEFAKIDDGTYVLPIGILSVEGADASTNFGNVYYILSKKTYTEPYLSGKYDTLLTKMDYTVEASPGYNNEYGFENVFEMNQDTYYSKTNRAVATYTFKEPHKVSGIAYVFYRGVNTIIIRQSKDGNDWEEIGRYNGNTPTSPISLRLPVKPVTKYLQVEMRNNDRYPIAIRFMQPMVIK